MLGDTIDLSWMTGSLHRHMDDAGLHDSERIHHVLIVRVHRLDFIADLMARTARVSARQGQD